MRARVELERVTDEILSSYDAEGQTGGPRSSLRPLRSRVGGQLSPDTCWALQRLHELVKEHGGDFRVTDGYRPLQMQMEVRRKYEKWLHAGKPRSSADGYDPATMKRAYVARPGRSFHNAGRAIDVDLAALKFPGVAEQDQLDMLWSIAKPLGWRPIILKPNEGATEAWHLDYPGPWMGVLEQLDYTQAAMAACLDIGEYALFSNPTERAIQAHLHRVGYDVGDIDGVIGPKTRTALGQATVQPPMDMEEILEMVIKMPTSG